MRNRKRDRQTDREGKEEKEKEKEKSQCHIPAAHIVIVVRAVDNQ